MKLRFHPNAPSSLDATSPRDYSVGLRGLEHQRLRVAKGLRGSKFGAANKGRRLTRAEIEAWKPTPSLKKLYPKRNSV